MTDERRDGFAVIDKPAGWTSHDVVAKVRGILQNRKVGHGGTLDPDATGVLLLGVGRGTRLLQFLVPLPKRYEGELVLGVETSTLDASGEVVARYDMSSVSLDEVREVASGFVGEIDQIPPMVSAVKVDGQRLHVRARRGEEVERSPRRVTVHSLDVDEIGPGRYGLSVECSSGTYIRSLAADIGSSLGGGAHLAALRRVAIGSFTVDEATSIEQVTVQPLREAVRDYPVLRVDGELARAVGHGRWLERTDVGAVGDGPWAVVDDAGDLLAMYDARVERLKPVVVVAPA
jgi:tRNA pseudouridine55 synthase